MDRTRELKIIRRGPNRRLFLGAALQGLGAMMVGCGYDKGPRDLFPSRRVGPDGSSGSGGSGGVNSIGGSGGTSIDPQGDGGEGGATPQAGPFPDFGPLGQPNELGVRLPAGYRVRLLATSGSAVDAPSGYVWPPYPDGGACFSLSDGGFIYVCNSEVSGGAGGVSALRFSSVGEVADAYSIARGTSMNCQGGAMPWGTYLTCEEVAYGRVLECDPLGVRPPIERPALGIFMHEGLTYNYDEQIVYLTEDVYDGGFYRFLPARVVGGVADLSEGTLQIARLLEGSRVEWINVPDPAILYAVPTRYQVDGSAVFSGGEGIWYQDGSVIFTTKGDDRVWSYDTASRRLSVLYHRATAANPILSGVDCVIGTTSGELLIGEDAGDMQIVVILPSGELLPLLQVVNQPYSEITGVALSPDGTRLFFSSQRGGAAGQGLTYEVTGPFQQP
jgi:uncharacterized protein